MQEGNLTPIYINLKMAVGGQIDKLWFFQSCIFEREGKALFFVTFHIVLKHNLRKLFIKFLDFLTFLCCIKVLT